MAQNLILGEKKTITVDRIFADNGQDAEYVLQGGKRVRVSEGTRRRPTILQRGKEFFYYDASPVTNVDDVDYLPEPYRTQAIEFVQKGKAKPLTAVKPRGRGRPKKADKKVIEIKDSASYRAAGGVEV